MIVECISNDGWDTAPNPRPVIGNFYEVFDHIKTNSYKSPYYFLKEIANGVAWTHKNFRQVDIDITEIKEILKEPVEVLY